MVLVVVALVLLEVCGVILVSGGLGLMLVVALVVVEVLLGGLQIECDAVLAVDGTILKEETGRQGSRGRLKKTVRI
jgi:hypothetical protein